MLLYKEESTCDGGYKIKQACQSVCKCVLWRMQPLHWDVCPQAVVFNIVFHFDVVVVFVVVSGCERCKTLQTSRASGLRSIWFQTASTCDHFVCCICENSFLWCNQRFLFSVPCAFTSSKEPETVHSLSTSSCLLATVPVPSSSSELDNQTGLPKAPIVCTHTADVTLIHMRAA